MSTSATTQQPNLQTAAPQIPDDARLHRLVVEAGKYLGLRVGESLPITEVVAQGEANGYSEREVYALLEHEGLPTDDSATIPVPPQGDVFGELWRAHRTPQATFSTIPEVQKLRQWLAQQREKRCTEYDDGTHQHKVQHAYSLHTASKRSGQAKDVGRHFIEEYKRFTTVVVTYCAEKEPSETIAEHASKFYPSALSQPRWELFNRDIDTEQWAGCRLLAPENPVNTPTPTFTHGHAIYWVEGWHDREAFEKLRETFLSEVDGATEKLNPLDRMIQVQHHTSAEIEPHDSVKRDDLDAERGATTAASGEVAANLPLLRARNALRERDVSAKEWARADAEECPNWIEYWLAHLRLGLDGDSDTSGISRWGTFGDFREIADEMKAEREYDEEESEKQGCGVQQSPQDYSLTDTEEEFVAAYLDADAPIEREMIETNIEENINALGGVARIDVLVDAIRQEAEANPL
jgi:hypothetical protein